MYPPSLLSMCYLLPANTFTWTIVAFACNQSEELEKFKPNTNWRRHKANNHLMFIRGIAAHKSEWEEGDGDDQDNGV